MALSIPVLLGTGREGRVSEHAAAFVLAQAKAFGFDARLVDVRDYVDHAFTGRLAAEDKDNDAEKRWSEIMTAADGLIVVSPEYNHGIPGELKLMLDALYEEYRHKPVAIIGTGGGLGGGRAVEQLRLVSVELSMVPIRNAVYFPAVYELFGDDGSFPKAEEYAKRLLPVFEELAWYGEALRAARERA